VHDDVDEVLAITQTNPDVQVRLFEQALDAIGDHEDHTGMDLLGLHERDEVVDVVRDDDPVALDRSPEEQLVGGA